MKTLEQIKARADQLKTARKNWVKGLDEQINELDSVPSYTGWNGYTKNEIHSIIEQFVSDRNYRLAVLFIWMIE